MDLVSIAEPAIIVDYEETVSKTASKMLCERKREVLVFEGGNYRGMVVDRDLAKRKINEPQSTKIGRFAKMIKPIPPETPLEDAINNIIVNDYKSIPVQSGERFFVLTKLNILSHIKGYEWFKDKKAEDLMSFPYCISSNDSISTAMSVLRNLNISKLPVTGENNSIEGVVETIDLLKTEMGTKKESLGERSGIKTPIRGVYATSAMNRDFPKAKPDTPVRRLIEAMAEKKTPYVIVEEDGKLAGIVTPVQILKLVTKSVSGVYVGISGIQEEDDFIKSVVDEEIRNETRKLGRIFPINQVLMHVDRYHKAGKRVKYSIKAKIITGGGMFFAHDHAWDITKAAKGILQKLEREMIKKKEKRKTHKDSR